MSVTESGTTAIVTGTQDENGPQTPLTPAQAFWYSVANLGYGAFYAFNNFLLPLFMESFTKNAVILGLMGSTHSVEGAVIQPLVGSASDRAHTRWGRRRPFMLIAMTLSALLMLLTPAAGSLPVALRLGGVVLGVFLFTVLFNVGYDPYLALMPDITPESQRGRVSGLAVLFGNLAQAGLLLGALAISNVVIAGSKLSGAQQFTLQFTAVALLMIVTTVLTCWRIKESKNLTPVKSHNVREEARKALRGLRTLREARLALLIFGVSGAGIGAVTPFLSLFVQHITNASDKDIGGLAATAGFVLMIGTALSVAPFGWLTDRIGAKWVVLIGCIVIGGACIAALWVQNMNQIIVVLTIAGLGNGAYQGASYPLLTELVPREEVGLYTGFQSTAHSLAQPLMIAITGQLINLGNGSYRLIFAVCAATMFVSMALLFRLRPQQALAEIAAHRKEQGILEP